MPNNKFDRYPKIFPHEKVLVYPSTFVVLLHVFVLLCVDLVAGRVTRFVRVEYKFN